LPFLRADFRAIAIWSGDTAFARVLLAIVHIFIFSLFSIVLPLRPSVFWAGIRQHLFPLFPSQEDGWHITHLFLPVF